MELKLSDISSFEYIDEDYVYDLEIEDNHNYFLSLNDIQLLVHNSSKTYSKIQLLKVIAEKSPKQEIILVGSSIQKIKKTLLKDFIEIMGESFDVRCFNKTDLLYTFDNGSFFQFMSADVPENFTGVKSHYCLLDEVNTFRYGKEIFMQLETRNEIAMFVCFNPANKFWITDYWDAETTEVIHSTYKDNPFIPDKIIKILENRAKTDINFYNVYTLGLWGALEGLIFKEGQDWERCDKMPTEYEYKFFGLDFGFNNATCLVENIIDGEYLYSRVVFSLPELYTPDIVRLIKEANISGNYIVGDSTSGTNMVKELQSQGIAIVPAVKGADSVMFGINKIKSFKKWYIFDKSIDLIRDVDNYSYMLDAEGNAMNVPDKKAYDPHRIDAVRYGISRFNV